MLDFGRVGASKVEASAITDHLREELLRTGKFTLVDRSQMDSVLKEQAFQQTGCTDQDCAVQVGRVLGITKRVTGRITKIGDAGWLVSAQMIDVETAETLRAESLRFRGDFFDLMDKIIGDLAGKLSSVVGLARSTPPPKGDTPVEGKPPEVAGSRSKGLSWWTWALIGLGTVAVVAVAGGGGGGGEPCASGCGSISASW